MKFKNGTWLENLEMAFCALVSTVALGYIAIAFIDDWILSLAKAIFLPG